MVVAPVSAPTMAAMHNGTMIRGAGATCLKCITAATTPPSRNAAVEVPIARSAGMPPTSVRTGTSNTPPMPVMPIRVPAARPASAMARDITRRCRIDRFALSVGCL